MKNGLNFKCEGNAIELKMYGEIGENYWKEEGDDNIYSLQDLENALKEEILHNISNVAKEIKGSFENIVGFPTKEIKEDLQGF